MSNSKKAKPRDNTWLNRIADDLAGARVQGGCEDCDAYQVMESAHPGFVVAHIYHDDWCPAYGDAGGTQ